MCLPGQTCPASPEELGSLQGTGSFSSVPRTQRSARKHRVRAPPAFGGHCRNSFWEAGSGETHQPCSKGFSVGISLRNQVLCPGTAHRAGLGVAKLVTTVQPEPRAIPRGCWMVPLFGRGKSFAIWVWAAQCHLGLAGVWSLDSLTSESGCSQEAVWPCLSITSCPETACLAEGPVLLAKVIAA